MPKNGTEIEKANQKEIENKFREKRVDSVQFFQIFYTNVDWSYYQNIKLAIANCYAENCRNILGVYKPIKALPKPNFLELIKKKLSLNIELF